MEDGLYMVFSNEANKRKKKSIKILKSEGVPFIEPLPIIEDSKSTVLQKEVDVCYKRSKI